MDVFKRSLAPITEEAWEEIDDFAKEVIESQLSARKVIDVEDPKGLDFSSVSLGSIEIPSGQKEDEVNYGIRMVKPIVETRISFELDMWEVDNISRGSKDPDFDPLEKAAKKVALFEEEAVFNGLKVGSITGISEAAVFNFSKADENISYLALFAKAVDQMKDAGVSGPYSLVIPSEKWQTIVDSSSGYPIEKKISILLGGAVILNQNLDRAFVISERGGDFILTLGSDFSIGYESHTSSKVKLFLMETFTFRVLEPRACVTIEL